MHHASLRNTDFLQTAAWTQYRLLLYQKAKQALRIQCNFQKCRMHHASLRNTDFLQTASWTQYRLLNLREPLR